ncbi:MFS transporter [Candidatus Avoscillospira sp. LCP25S3_F1]|uniref:MFS transporter n=1 Tax=Candidatus Avoscillospira sp. LCP25S3_F1 TaxID=3438825 RepID=UPI003F8DFABB
MNAFWRKYRLALCLFLAVLCTAAVLTGLKELRLDPRSRTVTIGDPTAMLYGAGDQTYIIAGGSTSILVLNEEGQYIRTIPGGTQAQGFYYAQTLAADEAGNLYIHDRLLSDNGKDVATERIAVYNSHGGFVDYLYEQPHDLDTGGENRNRIYGMVWQDGGLSFVRVDQDSFALCRLDVDTGTVTEQQVYAYPSAYRYLMYAAIDETQQVYFSDKYGSIWQAEPSGDHRCIYDASAHGNEDFFSIAANLACLPDGSICFNDIGQRQICRILPDGTVELVVGRGEPLAELPEAFNELPIYSYIGATPQGGLSAIYCEYTYDTASEDYVYDYCVYARDAQGQVLLNTAQVEKAPSVQIKGWLAAAAGVILAALLLYGAVQMVRAGWLGKTNQRTRIQMAVILAAVLSAALASVVLVGDLNQRYLGERTSKMTNMAVLMARDLQPEDIRSIDSPEDYNSPAYQRIDASVKEILLSDLNDDGTYCTIYQERNGIVCIIYSDEGLNNVFYPMSGVFAGSYEAEIYETGELQQFSAFSSAEGHYAFTLAPIFDESGQVVALMEVGTDLYAFTAANQRLIRETLLTVLMIVVTCVLLFSEATVFLDALRRNRQERKQGILRDVGIIRPIAFLIFFAGNMSTAFLPVYGVQLWDASMGMGQEFASAIPLSAEVMMTAIFSLFGGFLVDRMGTKSLIASGGILFMAGLALCGLAPNLWVLIGGSVVLGIGEGLVLVALNTFISNYGEEEQRNRGFSGYNAAYLSGMNCGTVVGSLAADQFGYRNVFYMAVAVSLAALVLAIVCLHKQTTPAEAKEQEEKGISTLQFLLRPRVWIFFLFMLMPYLISASFLSYFFPIFGEEHGLSTSFVAIAFLISGVIAIYLGPTLTRVISHRLGDRGSLILASAIYVGSFALFAIRPSVGACFAIIAMLAVADSFGLSMQAVYFSALPEVRLYGAGKAMGLNSAVESIAQTVGPMIFAAVLMMGVERGVMVLAQGMGVMLLIFVVSVILDRRRENVRG